jgi:hypothetical protein
LDIQLKITKHLIDPTNSAAKLAQNAIRIAQMSRQPGASMQLDTPIPQSISTPFGYLPSYRNLLTKILVYLFTHEI